jgi:hypothetical protein
MKNSKILVKLIGFNLLMLLFACGKEDATTEKSYERGQKLVQIDSTDVNGNKGAYLQFEYNQTGNLDNVFNRDDQFYYYYDNNNTLNKSAIGYLSRKRFFDVVYGKNEIEIKTTTQFADNATKYYFDKKGYPIKSGSPDNYIYYIWENGNLVQIQSDCQCYDYVLEYDDKVNPFAITYDKPFKNPQYLMPGSYMFENRMDIFKYSKNNVKNINDKNNLDSYLNISYQYMVFSQTPC